MVVRVPTVRVCPYDVLSTTVQPNRDKSSPAGFSLLDPKTMSRASPKLGPKALQERARVNLSHLPKPELNPRNIERHVLYTSM